MAPQLVWLITGTEQLFTRSEYHLTLSKEPLQASVDASLRPS